jgi:predicted secreted Zn-dependent protease
MLSVPVRLALCAAALLAAMVSSVPAKDVRTIHQTYVHYDVSGTTLQAISDAMRANSPPAANGYLSVTIFYFLPYAAFWMEPDAAGNMTCRPYNLSVVTDIEVILPRHPTIAEAAPEVQESWNRFITATEKHELRHAADFAEVGFGLLDALEAVVAPDCAAAQEQIATIVKEFSDRAIKLGVDYDVATNHGINEGALLQ